MNNPHGSFLSFYQRLQSLHLIGLMVFNIFPLVSELYLNFVISFLENQDHSASSVHKSKMPILQQ